MLKLCAFYAPRGIPPERILNATLPELKFFEISRDKYFSDCAAIIIRAVGEIAKQTEEARR